MYGQFYIWDVDLRWWGREFSAENHIYMARRSRENLRKGQRVQIRVCGGQRKLRTKRWRYSLEALSVTMHCLTSSLTTAKPVIEYKLSVVTASVKHRVSQVPSALRFHRRRQIFGVVWYLPLSVDHSMPSCCMQRQLTFSRSPPQLTSASADWHHPR